MTLNNVSSLLSFCRSSVLKLGLTHTPIKVEPLQEGYLGLTEFEPRKVIKFSPKLLSESEQVINTIVAHECAHVVAGLKAGHNKQWYAIANKYSKQLNALPVSENVVDKIKLSDNFWFSNYRYVYICNKCKMRIGFNNDNYSNIKATHTHCGGRWIKEK